MFDAHYYTPIPVTERASISLNVAEFGAPGSIAATLTSLVPPLICPSSLRPEPFSGRFFTFESASAHSGGFSRRPVGIYGLKELLMVSLGGIARKIFGSSNDRRIKATRPRVEAINALEGEMQALSDEALRARTDQLRQQLADGASVDDLLVPAFATVREAAKRVLGLRPFDVQLIGGMVLHGGNIAEMRTGEGKTLVATLPVYLNALEGKGVHVVTVNDYLARRDADWMGQIYRFLGLTVGVIVPNLDEASRKQAYGSDITYGTNNEFGFDYLRDNMKYSRAAMVQRPFHYAIVDEVDSILIDEARTPLIISGPTDDKSDLYIATDKIVRTFGPDDFDKDEKLKTVVLTEGGTEK